MGVSSSDRKTKYLLLTKEDKTRDDKEKTIDSYSMLC